MEAANFKGVRGLGSAKMVERDGKRIAIVTQEMMANMVGLVPEGRVTTKKEVQTFLQVALTEAPGIDAVEFEEFPLRDYKWDKAEPYPWWRVINEDGTLLYADE